VLAALHQASNAMERNYRGQNRALWGGRLPGRRAEPVRHWLRQLGRQMGLAGFRLHLLQSRALEFKFDGGLQCSERPVRGRGEGHGGGSLQHRPQAARFPVLSTHMPGPRCEGIIFWGRYPSLAGREGRAWATCMGCPHRAKPPALACRPGPWIPDLRDARNAIESSYMCITQLCCFILMILDLLLSRHANACRDADMHSWWCWWWAGEAWLCQCSWVQNPAASA
jgi:hypothetical protein